MIINLNLFRVTGVAKRLADEQVAEPRVYPRGDQRGGRHIHPLACEGVLDVVGDVDVRDAIFRGDAQDERWVGAVLERAGAVHDYLVVGEQGLELGFVGYVDGGEGDDVVEGVVEGDGAGGEGYVRWRIGAY